MTRPQTNGRAAARRWKPEQTDNRRLANLCGALDANLRQIETALDVSIRRQQGLFTVKGYAGPTDLAVAALQFFYTRASRSLGEDDIALGLISVREGRALDQPEPARKEGRPSLSIRSRGEAGDPVQAPLAAPAGSSTPGAAAEPNTPKTPPTSDGKALVGLAALPDKAEPAERPVRQTPPKVEASAQASPAPQDAIRLITRRTDLEPRTPNQRLYLQRILSHDISFGTGPAGTGKTYLAVACAVDALERDQVKRIVLTRPAVEAGERLGFLPGDLAQKVDPYLRPLYDALYDLLGFERVHRALERQSIEIAPLAYMRGRTLNHAFIILDEAQNTTPEQIKMFLTRLGFGSRAVVTGDPTQIDLPKGQASGLIAARRILAGVKGLSFTEFDSSDVIRHPLIARIVEAYERQARLDGSLD